jgi:creatine kinase
MTEQEEKQLIDDHFLFQKPSPRQVLAVCGAARDWPDSRGIFFNEARTFLLWVNEEDQMRIIAMQQGGNVKEVFGRWVAGVDSIERSLKNNGYEFMYDDHFGFLSTCPSNLGTGLRASVMLKVPKLYKSLGVHEFEELCLTMGLQARGERGEHSPPGPNGEFDVSNKARLGYTEVELVQQLIDGVDKLIALEEALPDN